MKVLSLACAAAVVCAVSADRARLGVKGGQFDMNGMDSAGRDIFGFDNKGVDKWGRPITDSTAGLVAPVGKADEPAAAGAGESKHHYPPPPPPKKPTKPKHTVSVEPSFTPIPITLTTGTITTTSMFVPTTAIYTVPPTYVPPEPTPSLKPQCQSIYVYQLPTGQCPTDSMKPSGKPGINTLGDFLACDGFRAHIHGEWQFLSYACNKAAGNTGIVTVLVCNDPTPYRKFDITY
eukprot:comp24407_c0_seq1/m.46678 comp24407_c0_seq1/g.46678  ORF comp24407_c0_seq1/g.46678 comp24407_c0_seq1/m.46678 type:complete len:234 (-) comp24407_c0_seq1:232-933(-)